MGLSNKRESLRGKYDTNVMTNESGLQMWKVQGTAVENRKNGFRSTRWKGWNRYCVSWKSQCTLTVTIEKGRTEDGKDGKGKEVPD